MSNKNIIAGVEVVGGYNRDKLERFVHTISELIAKYPIESDTAVNETKGGSTKSASALLLHILLKYDKIKVWFGQRTFMCGDERTWKKQKPMFIPGYPPLCKWTGTA